MCDPTAVKIRAEDGRSVQSVNISPFINNLPYGKSTDGFCTDDASGSTSQSANIIEALEVCSLSLSLSLSVVFFSSEDGRSVQSVNISPFNLPYGKSTDGFCTDDASGSTSQSANIIEALEVCLLVLSLSLFRFFFFFFSVRWFGVNIRLSSTSCLINIYFRSDQNFC